MPIKILHTSDWHLGKKLYKTSRLEEQRLFLDYLLNYLESEKIDLLIIAGDIFDTPRPSDEALSLYFQFLDRLQSRTQTQLCLISGNHDSGRFLDAPRPLLNSERLHISGKFDPHNPCPTIELTFANNQKLAINLLPFFRGADLLDWAQSQESLSDQKDLSPQDQLLSILEKLFGPRHSSQYFHLLVAHHLFGQFEAGGSEQGLYLSGLTSIPLNLLKDRFDYVALGHIHKAQCLQTSNPMVRYSGAPLPFRFSENKNKKMILLTVEGKDFKSEEILLPCFRVLKTINTNQHRLIEDIKQAMAESPAEEDDLAQLWEIKCQIDSPTTGLADLARELIGQSNIQLLQFQTYITHEDRVETQVSPRIKAHDYSTEKLFEIFYQTKFPEQPELPPILKEQFLSLLEHIRRGSDEN